MVQWFLPGKSAFDKREIDTAGSITLLIDSEGYRCLILIAQRIRSRDRHRMLPNPSFSRVGF
jgi:hypothetical protein